MFGADKRDKERAEELAEFKEFDSAVIQLRKLDGFWKDMVWAYLAGRFRSDEKFRRAFIEEVNKAREMSGPALPISCGGLGEEPVKVIRVRKEKTF